MTFESEFAWIPNIPAVKRHGNKHCGVEHMGPVGPDENDVARIIIAGKVLLVWADIIMAASRAVNLLFRISGGFILFLALWIGFGGADNVPFTLLERETVKKWATDIGSELWDLSQMVTRGSEMKARYQKLNVRIQEKDGETLLREIADNVQRMLDRKMDAVKCIMLAAEDAAEFFNSSDGPENFTYYSAKNSFIIGEGMQSEYMNNITYSPMYLTPDARFYGIPVNMSHSTVHVPTNVYDMAEPVLDTIKWSETLDKIFIQNYNSDPALSLQYFGSSYGLLRSYPAMKWRGDPDLFDCRNRFWYIEAATCSKDMVILMDNSGSMTGYRNTMARLTVNNILDTLNNNDFVNVYNYSKYADEVVPCFKDMLVQATLENINTLKDAVLKVKPEGHANLSYAFHKAFGLLEKYREIRGCSNSSSGIQCNQAIMLITDSVAGNQTEVFEYWNWQENSTYIPVRVFTYLVGQEVTKVREIQWMACLNKGYYVHIHSMNEVREQVFKYIPVIARPLVLQGLLHPTIWTPAYADTTDPTLAAWLFDVKKTAERKKKLSKHVYNRDFSQAKEDHIYIRVPGKQDDEDEPVLQEYRIMISVAIPAFDRKLNSLVSNDTRLADLLGVAGTDMPTKDMEKLTYNYKSGVNGYAFIITNNGYVLWHPDLRPVFRGVLKHNYNSIDLTEIELLDDGSHSREPSPEIIELRNAMVNHSEGKILGLRMKFHYDDVRRVAVEYKDFFFTALNGTPFSLGLSLPQGYGTYYVNPGDEVQNSRMKKIPITNYLKGSHWRIHPEWIYCKYHHQTRPFKSAEKELEHFLHKMESSDWEWHEQYEGEKENEKEEDMIVQDSLIIFVENGTESIDCNKRVVEEDEYYCDKGLVQLFTFDARITDPYFRKQALKFRSDEEEKLITMYNVTLKFVATESGLTRWLKYQEDDLVEKPKPKEHHDNDDDNDMDGIDVEDEEEEEQKEVEEEVTEFGDIYTTSIDEPWYRSAVLQHAVNPDAYVFTVPFDAGLRDDAQVMAAHSIFPRDGGMEAPASVVGYQFLHSALNDRFTEILSTSNCQHCMTCDSPDLYCYVLDHNGYIVWTEDHNSTGRFFGEIEGSIMDALRTENSVYRKVPIYDYQGLCFDEIRRVTGAASDLLTPFTHLSTIVQWFVGQVMWLLFENNLWYSANAAVMPDVVGMKERIEIIQVPRPCDQKTSLYLLQDTNIDKYKYAYHHCSSPHLVERIPHTNLVLVVIKVTDIDMHMSCNSKKVYSAPIEIQYNGTEHPCQKLLLNNLPRRRLSGCFSENILEPEVRLCGDVGRIETSIVLFLITWTVLYLGRIAHQ